MSERWEDELRRVARERLERQRVTAREPEAPELTPKPRQPDIVKPGVIYMYDPNDPSLSLLSHMDKFCLGLGTWERGPEHPHDAARRAGPTPGFRPVDDDGWRRYRGE